jgi:nucleotide-binding universal stress UspA family protein
MNTQTPNFMKKILIPTDFSENAENAVLYGLFLSQVLKAKPVYFYATHKNILTSTPHDTFLHEVEKDIKQKTELLHNSVKSIYAKASIELIENHCEFLVKYGADTIDLIEEQADSGHYEFVVMATHGATGLKKFFAGSNTSAIIQKSKIPVLAIPFESKYKLIKNIAFASDFEHIEQEVATALPLIKALNANLTIFTVHPMYPSDFNPNSKKVKDATANLREQFNYDKIEHIVINRAEDNDIEGGINDFVTGHNPDILIMFTKERSWFENLLDRSNTSEIVNDLKIPLLAMKKEKI